MNAAAAGSDVHVEPRRLEAMLNEFLGREMAAAETYRLALTSLAGRSKIWLLEQIAEHHARAAAFFRDYLVENGARPRPIGDSWRCFAGASSFIPEARPPVDTVIRLIIAALREGEVESFQIYRSAVDREVRLTEEVRDYLREALIPRSTLHTDALDTVAQAQIQYGTLP